ncbi:NAD(P)-dependent oxidoreductase [Leminorella grimontii]|uniref:NAD(P)-dependent oxidoreductase n=1 Tax=Leminorella grimontii TaxID=82981 RepID=UPI003220878D
MNIAIIGAGGKAGRLIAQEALTRGHKVTAVVRHAEKVADLPVEVLEKSVFDITAEDLKPFDAVIDAFNAPAGHEEQHQTSLAHLADLLAGRPQTRLLIVGGAGSLYVDDALSVRVMDTPDFPEAYRPTASNMGEAFFKLKGRQDVNWTYFSPAAMFIADGKRTGSYTVGGDRLLVNGQGESVISYADYAIAMVDELEQGKRQRQRFTAVSNG